MKNKGTLLPANIKIDNSKNHLDKLKKEIDTYLLSVPFETTYSEDLKTHDWIIKLKINRELPENLSATVGDIIHNLRAALDLTIYQVFVSQNIEPDKNCGFPIYKFKKDFDRNGLKNINNMSKEAKILIKSLKPYKKASPKLWQLHQLDIIDKHKIIIGIGGKHNGITINFGELMNNAFPALNAPPMPITLMPADNQFPLKDGSKLLVVKKGNNPKGYENTKNLLEIAFGDGKIIKSEPLIPTLQEFIDLTENIVNQFKYIIEKNKTVWKL